MIAQSAGMDWRLARLCLTASELAYLDLADPFEAAIDHGQSLKLLRWYDVGGTQAALFMGDGFALVSFRGTNEIDDIRSDRRYIKTDFPGGGRVHRGFLGYYERVREPVLADCADLDVPVFTTGHSLGAAPAQMAAIDLEAAGCYVFESPRVGNGGFVKRLPEQVYRFENHLDPVTWVPPAWSLVQAGFALWEGRMPTLYKHGGVQVQLPGYGHRLVHVRPAFEKLYAANIGAA